MRKLRPLFLYRIWFCFAVSGLLMLRAGLAEAQGYVVDHQVLSQFSALTQAQTDRVRALNIAFSHRSTGRIIMYGLEELEAQNAKYALHIVPAPGVWQGEGATRSDFLAGPIFGHRNTGAQFSNFFTFLSDNQDLVSIGFDKYCYVDMYSTNTAATRFAAYKAAVDAFKARNTPVKLVHFTFPLTYDSDQINSERSKYRDLILQEYAATDYVFDIAELESWHDGALTTFQYQGQTYLRMNPDYTSDGGHPNAAGEIILAQALWVMLARIADDLAAVNQAPQVNAGTDQSAAGAVLPVQLQLNAAVSDDGRLHSPVLSWSANSTSVSFDNAAAEDPVVTITAFGTYTLRLTANDGEFERYDELQIVVSRDSAAPAAPQNLRGTAE